MTDKIVFHHPSVLSNETLMRLAGVEIDRAIRAFTQHENLMIKRVQNLVSQFIDGNDDEACVELIESSLSIVIDGSVYESFVDNYTEAIICSDQYRAMWNDLRLNWHDTNPESVIAYFSDMQNGGISDRISPRMTPGQARKAMREYYDNMNLERFLEELSNYMEN